MDHSEELNVSRAELREVVCKYPQSLIIADCEAYVKTLFSEPETNRALASSDLIIECDLWDAEITPTIHAALGNTHRINLATAGGRDPSVSDFLADLSDGMLARGLGTARQPDALADLQGRART